MGNKQVSLNASTLLEKYRLRRGAWGYFLGLMAGMTYPFENSFLVLGQSHGPLSGFGVSILEVILVALVAAGIMDLLASGWLLLFNSSKHQLSEYKRAMKTKSVKFIMLAGLLGGPISVGGVCIAIQLCPLPYVMAISALFPVFGTIFSSILLKEKMNTRLVFGILIVCIGGALVSWGPPEGTDYPYFAIGIIMALVSSIGLGLDCTVGTLGMDTLDPYIAVAIKLLTSCAINLVVLVPIVSLLLTGNNIFHGWQVVGQTFATPFILFFVLAGLFDATTWAVSYASLATIGVGRSTAINASFAVWGIPISLIFNALGLIPYAVTTMCIVGSVILFIGVILVVINPKELLKIREH
jgi:drug/metabolite transporter (DMT)-like permease